MKRKRNFYAGISVVTVVVVLAVALGVREIETTAQATQAGVYQVDPFWPKPLPNRWVFGSVAGLAVDSRDHVWVVHRGKASIDPDLGRDDGLSTGCPSFWGWSAAYGGRYLRTLLH